MGDSVPTTEVSIDWIEEDKRLDASYFGQEGIESRVLLDELEENGIETKTIDEVSEDIFKKPRFKREKSNEVEGEPYLTPTDMFMFPIKPRKYIKNFPDGLKASPGEILLTRSGTVGRTLISNEALSDCVLSDDLIRIIPQEGKLGYLYAYLNTNVGRGLVEQDEFGATVKHVDPHQVKEIRVPILPSIEEKVDEKITHAYELRSKAHNLLTEAEEMLHEEFDFPEISKHTVDYFDGKDGQEARAYEISIEELENRLDASYHIPWLHEALDAMRDSANGGMGEIKELNEIADYFVPPRFKRHYVEDPDHGVPMLQGSHVDQIRPQGLEYIWEEMDNLSRYIIEADWILVTCSGTIGDLCLVGEDWGGWAATNHLLRIVPNEDKIHPGYLTIFLQSKYGQVQFQRLTYGGVVDEIGESGELVEDMDIFVPDDSELEQKIGEKVRSAYNKRDEANKIESKAVEIFEKGMETRAKS